MKIEPKIAELYDIDGLVCLEEACFDSDRISRRQYRYLIKSPTALVVLVSDNNRVIGSAVYLFRKGSDIARLYSLSVMPEYRHFGVAIALCSYCEGLCVRRGCREVRLEVKCDNNRAISFYFKNHYKEFGRYLSFYSDGKDAVRMKKSIS